jgi:hypothetical protein
LFPADRSLIKNFPSKYNVGFPSMLLLTFPVTEFNRPSKVLELMKFRIILPELAEHFLCIKPDLEAPVWAISEFIFYFGSHF